MLQQASITRRRHLPAECRTFPTCTFKPQRGRGKIRAPTGSPPWAAPAQNCPATSPLTWFYASPGSELLLPPGYHHFSEFVALSGVLHSSSGVIGAIFAFNTTWILGEM